MLLKSLINKSHYGTTGYISSLDNLSRLEQYIIYNLPVLKEFENIIIATNYKEENKSTLIEHNSKLWKKYFPNCIIIDSEVNRGHSFGTTDLDNMVFDYCKENNIEWLCKSDNDIILQETLFNKEIDEADFYYLSGIGLGGMVKYNFDFNEIIKDYFYPQTFLYFLNITKCDYLNNKEYLDETFKKINDFPNYNGKIWEYIEGWSCEYFLKECVERNKLIKYFLVPQENYINLLQVIKDYNIHDCSHKNIMVEGICHLQYPEQQIIEI
jgi:hypothetical protein